MSKAEQSKPKATRNAAETRQRILDAALQQFSEKTYAGARIEAIATQAGVNTRMLYHYFGDKDGLYVAVLERVLSDLRQEELRVNTDELPAIDGIMRMFDFVYHHMGSHPELIKLLSGENLMQGQFLKSSAAAPIVSSPVIAQLARLLRRGQADGTVCSGIDPLHLYVLMAGMSYFHRSNGHTLSLIFQKDIFSENWQRSHHRFARRVLRAFISKD
ncbi:MAG: hypothetical protein BGO65_03145 [Afipia sp. 64-13]|nr:MAG: hypothetical protein BGO65_03145 [Afipia sp. 64-13]